MVGLLGFVRPDRALPLVAATGPIAAALVLAGVHRRLAGAALIVAVLLVGLAAAIGWPALRISPFKPLPQALLVEGTAIVAERTSPIGLVQVVRSEQIPFRIVSGLSLMNRQEPAPQLGLFVDGEGPAPGHPLHGRLGAARLPRFDARGAALPAAAQLPPPARPPARSGWGHRPAPRPAPRSRAHRCGRAGRQCR